MSKLLLFEFRCPSCGHKHDELVKSDIKTHPCPECQGESKRLISTPRLDPRLGIDPDFSTMADQWARKHERGKQQDEKREREHGPDEWGSAGGDVRR